MNSMTGIAGKYEETVILLERAGLGVAELARRARAHERIRLVAADGEAVVVMSEEDLDQALQDARRSRRGSSHPVQTRPRPTGRRCRAGVAR